VYGRPMSSRSARRAMVLLVTATFAACAAPCVASAAGEPQIVSAGIDAQDRFVATWQLAPGTTLEFVQFSTAPIADDAQSEFLLLMNDADFECAGDSDCDLSVNATTYRSRDPVPRDRRYYVRVDARNADGDYPVSAMWVIDDGKPLVPGSGYGHDGPVTNTPVVGHLYTPPAPGTLPRPTIRLLTTPKTISGVLRRGIRARVTCPAIECYGLMQVSLGSAELASDEVTLLPDHSATLVLRPSGSSRTKLRRRSRARLRITTMTVQPGGATTHSARSIVVRR
jgi:hypothetical protein